MKRRRFVRRKRNGRNDRDISTRTLNAQNTVRKKSSLLPKYIYKKRLWEYTRFDTKYKSILSSTGSVTTPATFNSLNWATFEFFDNTNPFWTAAGGLQPQHQGAAVPTLNPSRVIVRGGVFKLCLVVGTSQTDDVMVRYQLVYPKQQVTRYASVTRTNVPLVDYVVAVPANQNDDWVIQDAGDYDQYFYQPVLDKRIILKPGDYNETRHSIKIRSIDADGFVNGAGMFPRWFIYVKNCANNAAVTVGLRTSYNLSFCKVDG